jgi:hypothetical protein
MKWAFHPRVIGCLVLALVISSVSCVVNVPVQSPQANQNTGTNQTKSFTIPAGGDYSFPIYLLNNQILHLKWYVKNGQDKVWFHIVTPSGKSYGFYEKEWCQYAGGTLCEGSCQGFTSGTTQFSPTDHDWGEGNYIMFPSADLAKNPVDVAVEYQVVNK